MEKAHNTPLHVVIDIQYPNARGAWAQRVPAVYISTIIHHHIPKKTFHHGRPTPCKLFSTPSTSLS